VRSLRSGAAVVSPPPNNNCCSARDLCARVGGRAVGGVGVEPVVVAIIVVVGGGGGRGNGGGGGFRIGVGRASGVDGDVGEPGVKNAEA
jgi:hypothetical protein